MQPNQFIPQPNPKTSWIGYFFGFLVIVGLVLLIIWFVNPETQTITLDTQQWADTLMNNLGATTQDTPQNWTLQFMQHDVLPKQRNSFKIRGCDISNYILPIDTLLSSIIITQNGSQNPHISLLKNDMIIDRIRIDQTPPMNEYHIHTFIQPHVFKKGDVIKFVLENYNTYKIMLTCIGKTLSPKT